MDYQKLRERFHKIRQRTVKICEPLHVEDMVVQAGPDVSPLKWHLGHTTWFFEKLILEAYDPSFKLFHHKFHLLFNSYYKSLGQHWIQGERGVLSRPTVKEVQEYRSYVDESVEKLFRQGKEFDQSFYQTFETGLHHEQQHQELLFMDLKFNLFVNPTFPAYLESAKFNQKTNSDAQAIVPIKMKEGKYEVGCSDASTFGFDNEYPRHQVFLQSFEIDSRPISNGEFLEFIEDKGYEQAYLWLSDGWDFIHQHHIGSPLYWVLQEGEWFEYTLYGLKPLVKGNPVCHLSYYEAQAFAAWKEKRLPTEFEWEAAAASYDFKEAHLGSDNTYGVAQLPFGDHFHGNIWEWTTSAYLPYPGYQYLEGSLREYNSKFMCGQWVLRGGCWATPKEHYRASYRNYFYPNKRWQISGLRLAKDN